MKIVLLGTGGYHPSDHRQTACMMIPSEGIILDAGSATYRVRDWIETDTLSLLLSHAHLDHVVGLTHFFDVLHKKNVSRVSAYAAQSKIEQIQEHLFAEALFPANPPIEFLDFSRLPTLGSGCRVTTFPLEHPGGSTGFRLDWDDRSLAYVTDTVASPEADYVPLIQGVDLLIHECYFNDDDREHAQLTGHSWCSAVGQVARAADAKRLVLVHVNPVSNEAEPIDVAVVEAIFPEVTLGVDGMQIDF